MGAVRDGRPPDRRRPPWDRDGTTRRRRLRAHLSAVRAQREDVGRAAGALGPQHHPDRAADGGATFGLRDEELHGARRWRGDSLHSGGEIAREGVPNPARLDVERGLRVDAARNSAGEPVELADQPVGPLETTAIAFAPGGPEECVCRGVSDLPGRPSGLRIGDGDHLDQPRPGGQVGALEHVELRKLQVVRRGLLGRRRRHGTEEESDRHQEPHGQALPDEP